MFVKSPALYTYSVLLLRLNAYSVPRSFPAENSSVTFTAKS